MKKCIICKEDKELDQFYKHSKMKDGRLNKCILCCKNQQSARTEILKLSPSWVAKEQARGRNKYKRLYKGKAASVQNKERNISNYTNRFPEKRAATLATWSLKRKFKGNHLHHWSYLTQNQTDVIEIRPELHYILHRFLIYEQSQMCYKTKGGELLDSRDKHYKFLLKKIREILCHK